MVGWKEACVGLAEDGGVGYPDDDEVVWDFADVWAVGDFMVDEYLGGAEDWPVSSYGSGAFNGSSRYLVAC